MNTIELGKFVKKARQQKGYNRKQFSDVSNIDYGYLTNIERGDKVPSAVILITIGQALEINPGLLLDILADVLPQEQSSSYLLHIPDNIANDPEALRKIDAFIGYLASEQKRQQV